MFNLNPNSNESKQLNKIKAHMDDLKGIAQIANSLATYIRSAGANRPLIVLCIGTDRSTGDCLGPLVGTKLLQLTDNRISVYGTLEQPVHATNLQQIVAQLSQEHPNSFIIAVDACLGRLDSVEYIALSKGALKPGAGVHKSLPPVGDAHLTGIVNVGGFMEYLVLQNTRLSTVMKMAERIAHVISSAYTSTCSLQPEVLEK